jgi:hypothetical protein
MPPKCLSSTLSDTHNIEGVGDGFHLISIGLHVPAAQYAASLRYEP